MAFFKEIEATGILPLHTLSHAPGVGFAADAAGLWRCTLGVAAVTYGAGALNIVNPVAMAYAEKSPLVVVSGAPGAMERKRGMGLHHQCTAAQCVLADPATAPAEIAHVLAVARDRSLPAYIELPRDLVSVDVNPVPDHIPPQSDPAAVVAAADAVMAGLRAAERPCLLLGVEVRRFRLEDAASRLASRLRVPTRHRRKTMCRSAYPARCPCHLLRGTRAKCEENLDLITF
eukprot:1981729-Rhodomonas_salina.1